MSGPSTFYRDSNVTLWHGDCLDILRQLPDASVDAVVTDPPYGLGFMGKAWDDLPPGLPWAQECLRVLKPGGHLLAFGGTRTWARLFVAIEDAGFEMRDSIAWLYGSGFPKSLNVGKDARFCQCDPVESKRAEPTPEHSLQGVSCADVPATGRTGGRAGAVLLPGVQEPSAPGDGREAGDWPVDGAEPGMEGRRDAQAPTRELHGGPVRPMPAGPAGHGEVGRVRDGAPASDGSVDRSAAAAVGGGEPPRPRPVEQRAVEPRDLPVERGSQAGRGGSVCAGCGKPPAPAGLGTALKPAFEPIVVARKPLIGTVAANVLAHGTGALNIDGCRVEGDAGSRPEAKVERNSLYTHDGSRGAESRADVMFRHTTAYSTPTAGRWPANVVLDDTQAAALDQQSGWSRSPSSTGRGASSKASSMVGTLGAQGRVPAPGDEGGASRFFPTFRYQAKAPTAERPKGDDGTAHPTVKPLELMRWLVRLVTPPGGKVLDTFAGSGTTGEACVLEGFGCVLIEREADYLPLIVQRITRAHATVTARHAQDALDFGDGAA